MSRSFQVTATMDAALEHAQSDEPQDDNKASLVGNKAETANPQIIQTDSQEEKKLLHKMSFPLRAGSGVGD